MIRAVIFDMDGVLSDTQTLHARVESKLFRRFGIDLAPDQITERYAGVRTSEIFATLLGERGIVVDIPALMQEKWVRMAEEAQKGIPAVSGSVDLVRALHARNILLAVASASSSAYVNTVLAHLGILDLFGAVVSGDDVRNGKPDPESFLLAAQKISVAPVECVVIEDGRSGMVAARRAGMKCIGFVPKEMKDCPADVTVKSLADVLGIVQAF